jgi:hypothetical protein
MAPDQRFLKAPSPILESVSIARVGKRYDRISGTGVLSLKLALEIRAGEKQILRSPPPN